MPKIEIKLLDKSIVSKKNDEKETTSQLNKNLIRKNRNSNLLKNGKTRKTERKIKLKWKKVKMILFIINKDTG